MRRTLRVHITGVKCIPQFSKNIEDPVDFYEFLFNSYKETPREKLLEFMNGAPDIEDLKKLPDDELRFVYAELLTHGATRRRKS